MASRIAFFCSFLLSFLFSYGGSDSLLLERYNEHYKKALEYNEVSLYAECFIELEEMIKLAEENNWEEKYIKSMIFFAETKRKTADFEEGLVALKKIPESIHYPRLHVRKLGRITALLNEGSILSLKNRQDSLNLYIDSALRISKKYDFQQEQASLFNEKGYIIGDDDLDSCIHYIKKAVGLFKAIKDTHNYIGAGTNLIRAFIKTKDLDSAKIYIDRLEPLLHNKYWYTAEVELYRLIASYYGKIGDSLNKTYYKSKMFESTIEDLNEKNSTYMSSFRVLYETKKYQEEAKLKALELKKEEKRRNELISYLIIFAFLSIGVVFLLFRERKLKKEIEKVNERYHMLVVESNHRIKNNLQMIISMLQYSSKGLQGVDTIAFQRISGKIQTISALHKHLYLDAHNEKVELESYFNDIIILYGDLSGNTLKVEKRLDKVQIRSERMVYFGLIFNEMLANTIEHANMATKEVQLTVSGEGNIYCFSYQDNSSIENHGREGTGSLLIKQLVQRVEGSNFRLDKTIGKYQFEFYA